MNLRNDIQVKYQFLNLKSNSWLLSKFEVIWFMNY